MPYILPASSPAPDVPLPTRNHRRTRSTPIIFATDKTPTSVFQPLDGIPRRRNNSVSINEQKQQQFSDLTPSPRRAVFSLNHDDESTTDDDDEEDENENDENDERVPILSVNTNGIACLPPKDSSIPFPTLESASATSPTGPAIPRVSSNPIILPNGKPLKPSLKSSSSPNLPDALPPLHIRSQSAPSTPAVHFPKNVHFKDERELETVRVFNKSGKPASINYGSGAEETETETEFEPSSTSAPVTFEGFPFPNTSGTALVQAPAPHSSEIPNPNASEFNNVFLETVTVPRSRPPVLRGSVLVRNITFAKTVAIRFTFDEWQTTSEVSGTYVTSLPSLPPEIKAKSEKDKHHNSTSVSWDWASAASQPPAYDRFSFSIKLEDVERKLLHSSMFVAVRFTAHGLGGGEWWDNNDGSNYKLSFQQVALSSSSSSPTATSPSSSFGKVNTMFRAINHSPSFPPTTTSKPDAGKRANFPYPVRPATPVRAHSNPSIPTYATLGTIGSKSKSRLSLSNYVAPSTSVEDDDDDDEPPAKPSNGSAILSPSSTDLGAEMTMSPTVIIGGMPATAPAMTLQWPYSSPPLQLQDEIISSPRSRESSLSLDGGPPTPIDSPKSSPDISSYVPLPQPIPVPSSSPPPSDNTYAEFVKKWCFHQSPPPVATLSSSSSTPRATTPSSMVNTTPNPWIETYGSRPTFVQGPLLAGFERA